MKIGNFLIFRLPKDYKEFGKDINEAIKAEFIDFGKPIPIKQMVRELYEDLQQRKTAKASNPIQFPSHKSKKAYGRGRPIGGSQK